MSSDDDKCFQCQETGNMACYCPHIRCFNCDDYGHIAADCPDKILPSGIQQDTETTTPEDVIDPHLRITIVIGITTMTIEIGTGSADLDPIPIIPDIGVTVTVTLAEVALDHITDPHATVHYATEAQAHTITDETPHATGPHHAGVSPETTVDLDHTHHINTTKNIHKTIFQPQSINLENQGQEIQEGHH